MLEVLEAFEPFGQGNERPLFLIQNVKVYDLKKLGKNKDVLRIDILSDQGFLQGVKFGVKEPLEELPFGKDDTVTLTAYVKKNIYKGVVYVQLLIKEMAI